MWLAAKVKRLVGNLFQRQRLETTLDTELRAYLDEMAERKMRKGIAPAEARRQALLEAGGLDQVKEEVRDTWIGSGIETTIRDVHYAFRTLRRSPGFATVAVLSLGLGIGGNTAIFSLLDTVLLKSLPVKNPEQLVLLSRTGGRSPVRNFPSPVFEGVREHKKLFTEMLACFDAAGTLQVSSATDESRGPAEMIRAQLVSGNYYSVLGVPAIVGRTLTPDDDRAPDAHPVAVISYGYWRRHFAGDAAVVGKSIRLNGNTFTIVGVTGPEFFGIATGSPPDVTVPLMMQSQIWLDPGRSIVKDPRVGWLRLLARLRTDVPEEKARAGLTLLFQQIEAERTGQTTAAVRQNIQKLRIEFSSASKGLDALRVRFSKPLLVLMSLVALVLLVACSNLAALLLARAGARQREIGTRLALGASRARLIRQLLTESILLSMAGGLLGLLFAYAATKSLLKILAQSPVPIALQFTLDTRLLAFTGGLAILTGLLFGLIPALQASSPEISRTLPRGGPVFGGSRIGGTWRYSAKPLVALQIALSLVLLVGAGLFVRSLENLESLDAGFQRDDLLLVTVNPSLAGYREPQLSNAYQQILGRLAVTPGIRSVSMSSHSLLSPGIDDSGFLVPGRADRANEPRGVNLNLVGPNFFETMGIPILQGRGPTEQDGEGTPRVAVITETLARQYFPEENPVGKRVGLGGPLVEIIGVAKDTKFNTLRDAASRVVYLPFRQRPIWRPPIGQMTFAIRPEQNLLGIAALSRRQIQEFDRSLPIVSIKTAEKQVQESLVQERLIAWLSGGFAILALVLASVGLAGTMAHAVARRTGEIGVRKALGAQTSNVIWLMVRESLILVLAGTVVGLAVAYSITRIAEALLFGVTAKDPATMLGAVAMLAAVAAIASLLPAWKAGRVDPVVALRHE